MIISLCCIEIFADTTTDSENIVCEKEEQIVADLKADGSVVEINTVNTIYSNNNKVIDYGNYDKITNISSADRLKYIDGEVSAKTNYDKLIYLGRNVSKDLPWDISIKYYLDSKNIDPDDIIGKSGKVDFRILINRNENYDGDFYDDFLVETTIRLNDNTFKNIIADKNAFSSDASSTILRYYKMPGEDLDITFSADATNFSLDEIVFNAMSVGFYENKNTIFEDDEDEKDAKEEINDLSYATEELCDGLNQIYDVTNEMLENIDIISDGAGKLNDGMNDFNSSSKDINNRIIRSYKDVDKLLIGYNALQDQLNEAFGIDEVIAVLPEDIRNKIFETIDFILDRLTEIKSHSSEIRKDSLKLIDGSLELKAGTELFNEKIDEFIDAIIELRDGTSDLFEGAGDVDSGVKDIKGRIDGISSGKNDSDNQSFSSKNNTKVLNVVFTLKTEKLEGEYESEIEDNQNTEKEKNFFEKIESILISYLDDCFTMKVYAAETKDYTLSDCGFIDKDGKVFATWDEPEDTTSYRIKIYKNNKRISDWLKTSNERYDITKYILKNKTGHYYFEVYPYKGGRDQKITSEELEIDSEYYMYLLGYEEKVENIINENSNIADGDEKKSYSIINQAWADKETLTYDEFGRVKNIRLYTSNRLLDVNNIIKKNFINSKYYRVVDEKYDKNYEDWIIGEKVKCHLTIALYNNLKFADNVSVECINANIASVNVINNNENLDVEIVYYPRCKIEKPKNIYIDSNDIVKWDRVENATHYRVRIYDDASIIDMKKVGANNINIKDYEKDNCKSLKVSAMNEKYENLYVESETIELEIVY